MAKKITDKLLLEALTKSKSKGKTKSLNVDQMPSLNVNQSSPYSKASSTFGSGQAGDLYRKIHSVANSNKGKKHTGLQMFNFAMTHFPEKFKGSITDNKTGKTLYKKGGKVKAKKPKDGRMKKAKCRDGIAQRGKTRGRMR